MLEQNDKNEAIAGGSESGDSPDFQSAFGEGQRDGEAGIQSSSQISASDRLSREFSISNFISAGPQSGSSEEAKQAERTESSLGKPPEELTARQALSLELLGTLIKNPNAGRELQASENTSTNAPELTIVDTDSNDSAENQDTVSSVEAGKIGRGSFKTRLGKDVLRAAKDTSAHVAELGHVPSSAKSSFHNSAADAIVTPNVIADSTQASSQTHIMVIGKPQSFRDLESTTGGDIRPNSNIVSAPPNVEAYPANPPAITIFKPVEGGEKQPPAKDPNPTENQPERNPGRSTDKQPVDKAPILTTEKPQQLGTILGPGRTIEGAPDAKKPGTMTPGESLPIGKFPSGNFQKPGESSPFEIKGANKDAIVHQDSALNPNINVGLPVDRIPTNHQIGTSTSGLDLVAPHLMAPQVLTTGKHPNTNIDGGAQAVAHQTVGLPIYSTALEARNIPGNTSATLSRYSSQEWVTTLSSQKRSEEREQITSTGKQEAQPGIDRNGRELSRQSDKSESPNQIQLDAFRSKHEQVIPSNNRNTQLLAYGSLPPGSAEKVFAGKSLASPGESQLMRSTTAQAKPELAMPQPLKLSNMDRTLFVTPNMKTLPLEATAKGMSRESAAIIAISAAEKAAQKAMAPADQASSRATRVMETRLSERDTAMKSRNAAEQQDKNATKLIGSLANQQSVLNSRFSELAPTQKKSEAKQDTQSKDQVRINLQNAPSRIESQTRFDAHLQVVVRAKFDPQIKSEVQRADALSRGTQKFVQIKAESNFPSEANRLERGFGTKSSFAGLVASDSMTVLQSARRGVASGETGCTKKGEDKRFFPGAELTLAAVLALSGARKRRRDEDSNSVFNTDGNEVLAKQVLHRRTYMVQANDTLQSIAELFYDERDAAGLIADLNILAVSEQSMDGRRIVELKVRQTLELPEPEEVRAYLASLPKNYDVEQILTIVKENNVDLELLRGFLGRVCDDKEAICASIGSTQTSAPLLPALTQAKPAAIALTHELPELIIDDEKLPPPAAGLGAVVTDLATLISRGFKRPTQDLGAIS